MWPYAASIATRDLNPSRRCCYRGDTARDGDSVTCQRTWTLWHSLVTTLQRALYLTVRYVGGLSWRRLNHSLSRSASCMQGPDFIPRQHKITSQKAWIFKDGDDRGDSEEGDGVKMLVTSQTARRPHYFTHQQTRIKFYHTDQTVDKLENCNLPGCYAA